VVRAFVGRTQEQGQTWGGRGEPSTDHPPQGINLESIRGELAVVVVVVVRSKAKVDNDFGQDPEKQEKWTGCINVQPVIRHSPTTPVALGFSALSALAGRDVERG